MQPQLPPVVLRQPGQGLSRPLRHLALVAAILIMLTSSFDIFLVIQAGGNYRFCQIVALGLLGLALLKQTRSSKMPVLGGLALCTWLAFQVAFVPVSGFWPKSLGYCLWLLLNGASMFSFVQLFSDDPRALLSILRWYVTSFGLIAAFGIVQFVLPLLGLAAPLVTQWWVLGSLARANGFSYEPSYFATYLLIGLVFVGSLRRSRAHLFSSRMLLAVYWLTLIGILISSSRMGIVFALLEIVLSQLSPWLLVARDLIRLRIRRSNLRPLAPSLIALAVLLVSVAITARALESNPATMLMLLNGTGVSDTAAHSVIQRADAFDDTLRVFVEHPLIGRSLGGVSYAIGELHGEDLHSFEASKEFEGMSVFAEVLAASGVIGLIPFLVFLVATIQKPLKLARQAAPQYAAVLRALVRSLVFLWAILQFNQNILRPYLWVHLAVLACVYAASVRDVEALTRPVRE